MNALLTGLGVPPEIQAFFNVGAELSFNYGGTFEYYGEDGHIVPATPNLWVAGNEAASHVVVTHSAMEAIAFITVYRQRYPRLEQLAFIATGNRLHTGQADWIRQHFAGRRFTLVFGKDLLGQLTAIKLTAGIKNIAIRIFHAGDQVVICRGRQEVIFNTGQISLHAFQEAFGIRPRFRTGKPVQSLTFLDQLKYDAER
ncbi:hypothetical protein [Mucilaginibacter gotjawali]|uniref:Uncharacterized protein n=1 Tax=Mucilaginibacter gotjawali TaxID=1550579 RepID=A0A839SKJ3_9SPHI|nr:hypothetical protein [Mucilaginibacter gotjawali]MBB3058002.1 hypothetical protein [Mucilaginibacter gotjawali]